MAGASFKDTWQVSQTFTGGNKPPEEVLIVGIDIPVEDWNRDLWDEPRLVMTLSYLDSDEAPRFLASIARFGVTDPVPVCKRRDMILAVDGRKRILGSRKVNEGKAKAGDRNLIQVPIIPDKSSDVAFTVRLANEYRTTDPPWVKAQQMAHLRDLGKSDADILLAFDLKSPITLNNWSAYLNLDPEIRALVEDHSSPVQIPFAVAYEIGRIGPREFTRHRLALDCLLNTGATLVGEAGRKNANTITKAVIAGTIKVAPPPGSSPTALSVATSGPTEPTLGVDVPDQPADSGAPPSPAPSGTGSGPKAQRGPQNTGTGATPPASVGIVAPKMSPAAARQVCAYLEPTPATPHQTEAEAVAYAVLACITGRDPQGTALAKWPQVKARFDLILRSPVTAPAGEVGSCPAKDCDRGWNATKKAACPKCGGSGKAPKKDGK